MTCSVCSIKYRRRRRREATIQSVDESGANLYAVVSADVVFAQRRNPGARVVVVDPNMFRSVGEDVLIAARGDVGGAGSGKRLSAPVFLAPEICGGDPAMRAASSRVGSEFSHALRALTRFSLCIN
jgi:hypothetical protein